jgi:hypothetical protein
VSTRAAGCRTGQPAAFPARQASVLTLAKWRQVSHNNGVSRTRTIRFLALVALLCSLLTASADAVWRCEGRICGTNPWFCCCAAPTAARDGNCALSGGDAASASACEGGCQCVLTIRAEERAVAARAPGVPMPVCYPLLIPGTRVDVTPRSGQLAHTIETRGPPIAPLTLASPSLRAPPVA